MKIRLLELSDDNKNTKKLRLKKLPEGWKDIKKVFYYQGFLYISKVICLELINKYYNNLFTGHFGIKKIWKLIAKKYYWPILQKNIEAYIKSYNICLALKVVCHELYKDPQSLLISTYQEKNLSMDFVTSSLILVN